MAKDKKVVSADTTKKIIAKPVTADFDVLLAPVLTEKSQALSSNCNQIVYKVKPNANKTTIKLAFERLFKVHVKEVRVLSVKSKTTTRGGRYQGKINGYKKAIISIADNEVVDLFKQDKE